MQLDMADLIADNEAKRGLIKDLESQLKGKGRSCMGKLEPVGPLRESSQGKRPDIRYLWD
ncbi:MAG: hypothetical protein M1840_002196 [Geoglossum simile]|nr:MAG: hypothetical protein M1840_002196 [Geoglossum simile]